MGARSDLIELLEGQKVYINTCRRDNHLGRLKLLLREEVLARNAQCLSILRRLRPPAPRPKCQKCQEMAHRAERLVAELSRARRKLDAIRQVCDYYEKQYPPTDTGMLLYELDKILKEG